jgi:transcriptional regulator with XRE-family HTH domain
VRRRGSPPPSPYPPPPHRSPRSHRLGQREFAARLGLSDTAVASYERPKRRDTVRLRYETQQLLDTALARADQDVIPTPTAASWIEADALATQTGYPVRAELRGPHEPSSLPVADGVVVASATFNTVNNGRPGSSYTFALGVHLTENEALRPARDGAPFRWPAIAEALSGSTSSHRPTSR